jgi:hypothetical protein
MLDGRRSLGVGEPLGQSFFRPLVETLNERPKYRGE